MHIAIDVRSLVEGRHSGVEEYTIHTIDALSRVGALHTYHLFYNSAKQAHLPKFRENVVVHPFRYPNKLFNTSQLLFKRPCWDTLLPVRPDVVLIPNPHIAPISSNVPFVTTVHDLAFQRFPEFLTSRRRIWHVAIQPRIVMQRSRHIIAVSQHTKEDIIRMYHVSPERISVVYSGVADEAFESTPVDVQRVRRRYALPEQFILFLGTLEPRKNISSVLDAFTGIAHTIPHHLVIAGERGWKNKRLLASIVTSPSRDKIHTIGFIPEQDKAALYAAADVFVYPSFYEGFGFPPLEAMLAGTPAVVSFNSSLPEVVGEWATLVDPYHTPQLASVLQEMLRTPSRVPESVREAIRKKYSWNRAATQTLKILESVV